jgi:hypothetical protein
MGQVIAYLLAALLAFIVFIYKERTIIAIGGSVLLGATFHQPWYIVVLPFVGLLIVQIAQRSLLHYFQK